MTIEVAKDAWTEERRGPPVDVGEPEARASGDPPGDTSPRVKRLGRGRLALSILGGIALLLLAAGGALRLGVNTGVGRSLIMDLANGVQLGPLGRLRVEGLDGDVLGRFSLRRLTIVDPKGVWLDASNLSMRWRPGELFSRRFHAERIDVAAVRILRQPVLTPQRKQRAGRSPVSVSIDQLHVGLQTLPAFSVRRGLWDISGGFRVSRDGAADGRIDARSRMHAGDGVSALFRVGKRGQIVVRIDAAEASGGGLSGALGLPADQRLSIQARAGGTAAAGSLNVAAVSGALAPLTGQARWNGAGGTLRAHVLFSASRLTGFLAERAGPEAELTMNARHDGGDVFDVQGALVARDASVLVHGPVDWRNRRATGLGLELQVAALSRWLTFPKIGPTRAVGQLTGDLDRFQFKGALDGRELALNDYTLSRAAGPASFSRGDGQWRLQTDLAGSGGMGRGLTPALLGPAPHVQLDLTQLKDRRLLFQRLAIQGSGLKLDASGGAGLFGGLSFKGTAQAANLAAAHPGSHGAISASWSASRPKGAKDWSIAFDAHAANFASGYAQVDHFLGAAPALKAQGGYGPDGLAVARADLSGGAIQTTFKGRFAQGQLDFDGDWSARGPFDAGPVEIAGVARGVGKLTGAVSTPHVALTADIASIDLGRLRVTPAHLVLDLAKDDAGVGGDIALTGSSRYGPARAKAAFRIATNAVDLTGVDADAGGLKAAGAISLRDGAPSTANLTVDARAGAFLSSGHLGGRVKLAQQPGGAAADIALAGQDVSVPEAPIVLHSLRLSAVGPWARLPFQVAADSQEQTPWRFSGAGVLQQTGAARTLELNGQGAVRKVDFRTLQPALLALNGAERDLDAHLAVGGGRADVTLRQSGAGVNAKAVLGGVALATFDSDFTGVINGAATLSGQGSMLGGALDATVSNARSRDAPADLALNGRVQAQLANDRLHLVASASNPQGLRSQFDVMLPASAAAQPFHLAVDRTRPMQGSFSADGELRPLWDLLLGGEQTLSGRVAAQGAFAGTLNDPHATGQATLSAGRFEDGASGLVLQGLALRAAFGRDAVQVQQASGSDGHGGTVSGSGAVSLQRGGGSTFELKLNKFRLFDNDLGRASASGDVAVNRDAQGRAKLTGALKIDRADITANAPTPSGVVGLDVVEIHRTPQQVAAEAARPRAPAGAPVSLDVTIRAPRGVFIRGKGLDVELSLDAHVGGTASHPDLGGTANLVLGSYDFAGKRFDFDHGVIRLGSTPQDIRLDLSATLEEPTLTAVVKVAGTAARPEITLSSTPVLPQDEVLSQVLFGASSSQLAPAQAAELASALASLSRGGGFDLLGRLRTFAGLDRLALGAGTTGTGVAGGKYINDNVYIELIGGGREGPAASVEWRVRKNFSIISQVGTQGDAQLSIQFRRNY